MTTRLTGSLTAAILVLATAMPVQAVDESDPVGNPVDSSDSMSTSSEDSSVSIQQVHTTFEPGDVFVAVSDGKVQWHLPDGTLNMVLDTGEGGFTTGMAFDDRGHLFLTGFSTHKIYEFDSTGTLLGVFYTMDGVTDCNPESIVFDAAGNMLVGHAGCNDDVLKIAPDGTLLARYDVAVEDRGSDWIDLEPDQCTLRYTSEGTRVLRYDICEDVQLSDWGSGLTTSYALRNLPNVAFNPALLVASTQDIRQMDAGETVASYDASGEDCWFALNLDPGAETFWSADFCSSNVYQFDTSSGDILGSFNTGTASSTVFGLAVFGELGTSTVRDCGSEDLSGAFGEVLPDTGAGERVTVRYDARFLVDESRDLFTAEARAIAEKIQARAEHAVGTYGSYGFTLPETILIEIKCQPKFGLVGVEADGFVGEPGVIQLRLERVQNDLAEAAVAGFPAGDPWNDDGAAWKNLIDHEVFHTVQYEYLSLQLRFLGQQLTLIESPAMLAQDLFPETDDLSPTGPPDGKTTDEYLEVLGEFASNKPTVDNRDWLSYALSYYAPGVIQYWGERFGPQGQANLEQRVADFLKALIATKGPQPEAYSEAIDADALAALRDYHLAHYGLRATNISAGENSAYAILDAETGPAYPAFPVRDTLDISAGAANLAVSVAGWAGDVFEVVNIPEAATHVALRLDSQGFAGFLGPGFLSAVVPINPGEEFIIDPELFLDGPTPFGTIEMNVPVSGRDRVAIVFVNGSGVARTYDVTAEPISGVVEMQFVDSTGDDPHLISTASDPILLQVVPTVDGETVAGDLPLSAFDVTIGGTSARISNVDLRDGVYHLTVWAPAGLADGSYSMTLTFAATDFDVPGGLLIDANAEPTNQLVRADTLGELGQGETAAAAATVTPGAQTATFELQWMGSDFDLTLTAPSGRIITEDSTDSDVTVSETSTSVTIVVAEPEDGAWQLEAFGSDVPEPEPVDYDVTEAGAPLFGEAFVASHGEAGLPLHVAFGWGEPDGGVVDGTVVARVTDPGGVERVFPLQDDGASGDTGADDGVYGAQIWATDLAGNYQIEVLASGTTVGGASVQRQAGSSVTLGTKVDTDGDGVADDAESLFGLDPIDPSDGNTDHDGDGLGLDTELAVGTDPVSWDTDGGGENDQSELNRGLDPLDEIDDGAVETVRIGARPQDDNLLIVDLVAIGGTGSVRVHRIEPDGTLTDLGLHPGSGATISDGPLTDGDYRYLAVAVADSGAESGPYLTGTVTAATDVTSPDFRITLNSGTWDATTTEISVAFTDLTESVPEMRLATSESALATTAWEPFSGFTTVTIPNESGQHFVYAQVRDDAGNVSRVGSSFVFYDDETPPPIPSDLIASVEDANGTGSPDDVILSWNAVSADDLSHYVVYRNDTAVATVDPTGTATETYTDLDLAPGSYTYAVSSVDLANNESATSEPASVEIAAAGTAQAWGRNSQGQLGNSTTTNSSTPVDVSDLTGVATIGAGGEHSLAALSDGTAWAWGQNANGQLGDGTLTDRSTPVQVSGLTGITQVDGGLAHSLALRDDGTVWAWGLNQNGQLGDGTTTDSTTPVQVSGLSDVVAVASGGDHSLALKSDGTVWAWGKNSDGQLGNGSKKKSSTPVQVSNLTDVTAIAAGDAHSLAVGSEGSVWAWGDNFYGQLGDNSTRDRNTPVQVTGLTGGTAVAGGAFHSLGVKSDGTVWAWGRNVFGQLGDGTTTDRDTPVQTSNLTTATGISAGAHHSLAVASDGNVSAWGLNLYGQLGDGTTTDRSEPVQVSGVSGASEVAAGAFHSITAD